MAANTMKTIDDLNVEAMIDFKGDLVGAQFETLKDIIEQLGVIKPFHLEQCRTFEKLWRALVQRGKIKNGDYHFLKSCFEKDPQFKSLAKKVDKYHEEAKRIRLSPNVDVEQTATTPYHHSGGGHASFGSRPTSQPPVENEEECYKMNSVPRGFCIIINNVKFYQAPGGVKLNERKGSDVDADNLTTLFKKLKFTPERHDNLSSFDIIDLAKEVAVRDHTMYNCLVFCILSHGSKGCVFGADGIQVEIHMITDHFKGINCTALIGKPKLFFIQACQGSNFGTGFMAPDNVDEDTPQLVTDGPNNDMSAARPNTADFLIGYSTVPEYVSFRNEVNGSWYISKLVEMLDKHSDGSEDLVSIMVKVNYEVTKKVAEHQGGRFQQMPEPVIRLCKKVYLKSY